MQYDNNTTLLEGGSNTISLQPGVKLTVSREHHHDYVAMRAAQLSAINHLLTSGDFEAWDENIKADAKWLAASLADELKKLLAPVTIGENIEITENRV